MRIKDIPTEEDLNEYMEKNDIKEFNGLYDIILKDINVDVKELFKKYNVIVKEKNYEDYYRASDIFKAPAASTIQCFMVVDILVIAKQKRKCYKCKKYNDGNNNYCVFCGHKL